MSDDEIDIEFRAPYKSITHLEPTTLPVFTVLSGPNGSGKTHLLQSLSDPKDGILARRGGTVLAKPQISYLAANQLAAATDDAVGPAQAMQLSMQLREVLRQREAAPEDRKRGPDRFKQNENIRLFATRLAAMRGKKIDDLATEDLDWEGVVDERMSGGFLNLQLGKVFKKYSIKHRDNLASRACGSQRALTDSDFVATFGRPPWVVLDRLLERSSLQYRTCPPGDLAFDATYHFRLAHIHTGTEIRTTDLSAGERTILALVAMMYNRGHDVLALPKLLLLDEPDASLHPQMKQVLLRIITEVLVEEENVAVIMTTHSPTTVALAPPSSLRSMNHEAPRIRHTTPDAALQQLCVGLPFLSVSIAERRAVIVEAASDVFAYEEVFRKTCIGRTSAKHLNFISVDKEGSNSDTVKQLVAKLRSAGMKDVFGIVDWDLTQQGDAFVFVLGKGERYTLENYIFDPLIIAAFALREKWVKRSDFGLDENLVFTELPSQPPAAIQQVVDQVCQRLESVAPGVAPDRRIDMSDATRIRQDYWGDFSAELPTWFLRAKGHLLRDHYRLVFPSLKNDHLYGKDAQLADQLLRKVIDEVPGLLPRGIVDVLHSIQDA